MAQDKTIARIALAIPKIKTTRQAAAEISSLKAFSLSEEEAIGDLLGLGSSDVRSAPPNLFYVNAQGD